MQIEMPVQETVETVESAEIRALQNKLEELLNQQPLDEQRAKETAIALAAAQYDAIGNAAYETERLRRVSSLRWIPPTRILSARVNQMIQQGFAGKVSIFNTRIPRSIKLTGA